MLNDAIKGKKNIGGKGEIARYEQFLLLPQCFSEILVVRTSDSRYKSKSLVPRTNRVTLNILTLTIGYSICVTRVASTIEASSGWLSGERVGLITWRL